MRRRFYLNESTGTLCKTLCHWEEVLRWVPKDSEQAVKARTAIYNLSHELRLRTETGPLYTGNIGRDPYRHSAIK